MILLIRSRWILHVHVYVRNKLLQKVMQLKVTEMRKKNKLEITEDVSSATAHLIFNTLYKQVSL